LAEVPESSVQDYVVKVISDGRDLTTAGILRLAKTNGELGAAETSLAGSRSRIVDVSVAGTVREASVADEESPVGVLDGETPTPAHRPSSDDRDQREGWTPSGGTAGDQSERQPSCEDSAGAAREAEAPAATVASRRPEAPRDEPSAARGLADQPVDHLRQFREHIKEARVVTRRLNRAGLRAAAREVESLACELSDTLQAMREAEPPSVADVADDAVDLDYYQVGEEELP
jgi:hypothetical protein